MERGERHRTSEWACGGRCGTGCEEGESPGGGDARRRTGDAERARRGQYRCPELSPTCADHTSCRLHMGRRPLTMSSRTRLRRIASSPLDSPCLQPSLSDPDRRRLTTLSHRHHLLLLGPRTARLPSTGFPNRYLPACTTLHLARSRITATCTGPARPARRLTPAPTTPALPSTTPALRSTTLSYNLVQLRPSRKRHVRLRLYRQSLGHHPPSLLRFGRIRPSPACSRRNTRRRTRASLRACSASTKVSLASAGSRTSATPAT